MNDDCSQLSFEVYNVYVAQKLRISESYIPYLLRFIFRMMLASVATFKNRH